MRRFEAHHNRIAHRGTGGETPVTNNGGAMRKAILMMLLAGVSSSAAAEWVKVKSGETITTYADPATIRREGNMVEMWTLSDYKAPDSLQYMSRVYQHEYDCKEERIRVLYMAFHTGNMGGGATDVVLSHPTDWTPVPPGSTNEVLWKFACGKR